MSVPAFASTSTWSDRPRRVVVSGVTMTKGNPGPKVSGGPITSAGRCAAGSPGYALPKSTSQRSSIEAIGHRRSVRFGKVGRPNPGVGAELGKFGRHLMGEALPPESFGGISDRFDEGGPGRMAQLEEASVGVGVYTNGCGTHAASLHHACAIVYTSNRLPLIPAHIEHLTHRPPDREGLAHHFSSRGAGDSTMPARARGSRTPDPVQKLRIDSAHPADQSPRRGGEKSEDQQMPSAPPLEIPCVYWGCRRVRCQAWS